MALALSVDFLHMYLTCSGYSLRAAKRTVAAGRAWSAAMPRIVEYP
jgi:hypothetical protein